MDQGSHFHRCDFQVHSPRDINWNGHRPVSEEERREYAKSFIKACREKGLDAVAITDHHDVGFFSYIREAVAAELDSDGQPVAEQDRLVVFPGMELTLGIGCQAIVLFDADFPLEFLPQIPVALSVVCNAHTEPSHAPVQRLDHFTDFKSLHERLDELSFLRGHYIVLPNVSRKGASTLQRQGFSAHYRTMPCVGGYLDHAVDSLGVGDRSILEGKVAEYGFKPLGIFPTSDHRHADFSQLGVHSVWVKWSEPTAEALRQACLARKTRILHAPPQLPAFVIESMHVSLSKFLGPIDLSFNPQFTCLIGGRGTGKSTILEYLRWGLCDQPAILATTDDVADFQAKRTSLIEKTLVPHKAVVSVNFAVNGVRHVVRRKTETGEIHLKVGDEAFKQVREQDIRELFPLQAYSQKQLSVVGVRAEELLRFVQAPVARRLSDLRSMSDDSISRIRASYNVVLQKKRLSGEISRQQVELVSLEQQLDALRKGLRGLSDEDQAILKRQERYSVEQSALEQWQRNTDRASEVASRALADIEPLPTKVGIDDTLPNGELLQKCEALLVAMFSKARHLLQEMGKTFSEESTQWQHFLALRREWEAKFQAHTSQYNTVKKQAVAHEAVLKQIADVEKRIKALRDTIAERKATLESQGSPEDEYEQARERWISLFRERGELLQQRCNELTTLSGGAIRAIMRRGAGVERLKERLTAIVEGTGIKVQAKKIEDLCSGIAEAQDSVAHWGQVLSELEGLAGVDFEGASTPTIPETPILIAAGFNKQDIERIAKKIRPEDWLEIAITELEDMPLFEYMQREGEYIPFANASAGQQATALLRVLMNQQGPPLVIDQPEEDLDNQVILKVVEEIWKAKKNRQIIFSSHNANIVVNGDADLVVCCDYRVAGDQSGGKIKCEGAIDVDQIRKEITVVMEGGRAAFEMRRDKYGF
jgi:chromosome segregation protein